MIAGNTYIFMQTIFIMELALNYYNNKKRLTMIHNSLIKWMFVGRQQVIIISVGLFATLFANSRQLIHILLVENSLSINKLICLPINVL